MPFSLATTSAFRAGPAPSTFGTHASASQTNTSLVPFVKVSDPERAKREVGAWIALMTTSSVETGELSTASASGTGADASGASEAGAGLALVDPNEPHAVAPA